jgi:hypothetical protein
MISFEPIDAFIAAHGVTLYIVFLNLSMVAVGFLLASHTLRTHRVSEDPPRRPMPRRRMDQPPILPPAQRQVISVPKN